MQKVLKDQTATIVGYARLSSGGFMRRAPASASAKIVTPAVTETAYTACAVQSYATTLTAAASDGDDDLAVNPKAGFVSGTRYLIDIEGDDDVEVVALAKTVGAGTPGTADFVLPEQILVESMPVAVTGAVLEGATYEVIDHDGLTVVFEFDTDSSVGVGHVAVPVLEGTDTLGCVGALQGVISASALDVTVGDVGGIAGGIGFTITQGGVGEVGNTAITTNLGPSLFPNIDTAFTGGTDAGPTVLTLTEPLVRDIASGTALRAFAVTCPLTADHTEIVGNGVVRFRAVIDGVTYDWDEQLRIQNRFLVSTLTATRLRQAFPIVDKLRPEKDRDFEEMIRLAWDHEILPLLEIQGMHEDYVLSAEALEPLHALACVLSLARPEPTFPRDALETLEKLWTSRATQTFARASWYAPPAPEEPAPAPEAGAPRLPFQTVMR